MFRNKFLFPLLAPETIIPAGPSSDNKEDIIDFLKDDEPDVPDVIDLKDKPAKVDKKDNDNDDDDDKDKDDKDDELEVIDDELNDIEEDLKDPEEKDLELVTPVRRSEILKLYPDLFKKFPYLEKAYYREQAFTQLLPTLDDAREAVAAKTTLDNFEQDLLGGDTEKILASVKQTDPKAFAKIADNYLGVLAKVDAPAYHTVIGNIISHTIHQMVSEGRRSKNEALEAAAQILNQFVFTTSDYVSPKRLSADDVDDKPNPKEEEVSNREKAIIEREFNRAQTDVNTRVGNSLKATIEANIDPKDNMSDYVKRNAIREANETIEKLMERDSRFRTILDRLWENAARNDFDKSSTDKIREACISKARTLLPSVIKTARNAALKGMGKRVVDDSDDKNDKQPIRNAVKGRANTPQVDHKTSKGKVPEGMSTLEFLNSD